MAAGASWPGGEALSRRLLDLSETMKGTSADRRRLEAETEEVVRKGVTEALLAGKDEQGRDFAPLAPSTMAERRSKGIPGSTPFITKGQQSSIITQFRTYWESASPTVRILRSWWDVPWMKYHWNGGPRLPKRRPGLSPAVIEKVRALHRDFAAMLRRKLKG